MAKLIPFIEGGPVYEYKKMIGKKFGYKNIKGEVIISPQFDDAHKFSDDLARVCINGLWGYINSNGDFVIEPKYDRAFDFHNGLAEAYIKDKFYLLNKSGEVMNKVS